MGASKELFIQIREAEIAKEDRNLVKTEIDNLWNQNRKTQPRKSDLRKKS